MRNQSNFILQKKRWQDLNPSVRMYGTSEPPEMQLDNMWEVVSRSTGERFSRVFNDGNVIESYEYGELGERLFADTVSFGECQYVYDKSLKLIQAGEVKYYYDAKGRLVLKQDNGQITKYSYLSNGALHKAQIPDGRIIEYHFDSEGMRIAKSVNGTVTEKYLWKDFTTLEAIADGAGQNVKVFAYDDEGDPVAMIYNDQMYYLASDQVGSIYMVADGNGNKVEQIICDSFGNLIVDTDGTIDIPLGFAAGLLDKDTGLVHFGYREYDPEIGRFTTPDPIGFAGGDVDVYGYCWDDPNNFVDRDGLKGKSEEKDSNEKNPKSNRKILKNHDSLDEALANGLDEVHQRVSSIKRGGEGRGLLDGPKYGKWGGGRYSGGVDGGKIGTEDPVDSSDEAYKKHDLAYEKIKNTPILGDVKKEQKRKIKEADKMLVKDLEKLDDDPRKWENTPEEKNVEDAINYKSNAKLIFNVKNYVN